MINVTSTCFNSGLPSSGRLPTQSVTSPTFHYLNWSAGYVKICFRRFPEDGSALPKHVEVTLMNCVLWSLLYCIVLYCMLLSTFAVQCIEHTTVHDVSSSIVQWRFHLPAADAYPYSCTAYSSPHLASVSENVKATLLGRYIAFTGGYLPTFRDNLCSIFKGWGAAWPINL